MDPFSSAWDTDANRERKSVADRFQKQDEPKLKLKQKQNRSKRPKKRKIE